MSKYYDEKAKIRSDRYKKEKRDKLQLDMPKGKKEIYRSFAQSREQSLTSLIMELIEAEMKKSGYTYTEKEES